MCLIIELSQQENSHVPMSTSLNEKEPLGVGVSEKCDRQHLMSCRVYNRILFLLIFERLPHSVDVHCLFHVADDYSVHHADADRSSSLLFAYRFRSACH